MVPAGSKAKRLSSVNHTTKTIRHYHHHHHHHQCVQKCAQSYANIFMGLFERKFIYPFLKTMIFPHELWTIFPYLKYTITEIS